MVCGGAAWACMEGRSKVAGPLALLLSCRQAGSAHYSLVVNLPSPTTPTATADDAGGAQASRPRLRHRPATLNALGERPRRALSRFVETLHVLMPHHVRVPFSSGALAVRVPLAQRHRVAALRAFCLRLFESPNLDR
jgi:hypothetical protein